MSQNKNNPGDTPRTQLYKRSLSTQYIKEELRRRFQERLKLSRSNQQCRNRNFYSNIVSDVQKQLITTEGLDVEVLNTEEMLEMLLKVEQEVNQETLQEAEKKAEDYQSLMEQELNVLLQDTNYICRICEQPIQSPNDSGVICSNCINLHFHTEKL